MTTPQPFNTLGRLRFGAAIYNRHDQVIGRSIELYGEYAIVEASVYDQVIGPGHVVIDAAAGIGIQTIFLARKVGPDGHVLAFEPHRLSFQTLCGNIALNSIENTHCWNMLLGAEPGEISLPSPDPHCKQDFRHPTEHKGTQLVTVATIDSFSLPGCDFLRIADESRTADVLRGGRKTIEQFRPVLHLACHGDERDRATLQLLGELGYNVFRHDVPLYYAENFHGNAENVFGDQSCPRLLALNESVDHELTGFAAVDIPHAA